MATSRSSRAGRRGGSRQFDKRAARRRRKRAFGFFWLVVWSVSLYWLMDQPFWLVAESRATSPDPAITQWAQAQLQPAIGAHLLQLDPQRWSDKLEANPLIKHATVRRWLFPARLEASISVRRPWFVAEWTGSTDALPASLTGSDTISFPAATGMAPPDTAAAKPKPASGSDGKAKAGGVPLQTGLIDRDGHVLPVPAGTKAENEQHFRVPPPQGNRVDPLAMQGIAVLLAYQQHDPLPEDGYFDLTHPHNVIWRSHHVTVWLGDVTAFPDELKVKLGGILPLLLPLAREKGQNLQYLDIRDWQNPVLKTK